ncbi:MAG TPA: hypothetical protein VJN92_03940 [Candidatus Acidoferrum sp.]|nr:hypothetical protein [Candidatus Acidoferrum sp.]
MSCWCNLSISGSMDVPAKRRFKNPERITPPAEETLATGLADFNGIHDRVLQLVEHTNGMNLARAKFQYRAVLVQPLVAPRR